MIQAELELRHQFEVGEAVWWTNGLRYLCATYKPGGKMREEHVEQVTILETDGDDHFVISIPSWHTPIHTCRRWLSPSENQHCEAVIEAYA